MADRFGLAGLVLATLALHVAAFPRVDANGELLPERAIARFGSARFRHPGPLVAVATSADGKLVAASSADPGMVRVWERGTGLLRDEWRFAGPAAPEQLAFSPDGRRLFAGRTGGRSKPWAARELDRHISIDLGPSDESTFQTLASDGRHGVVVIDDRVLIWNLAIDKQVGNFERPDRRVAHVGAPELGWVIITHNRTNYVATRLSDGKALWTADGDWDGILPNQPTALSRDGRRVAIRTAAGHIDVFSTATGKSVGKVAGPDGAAVAAMRLSPDGRSLAVSWKDRGARLYELSNGRDRARLSAIGTPRDLAFMPDSKTLAAVDPDGARMVRFFDAASGNPVDTVLGHSTPISAIAFAPDGSSLACTTGSGGESTMALWEVATGRSRWAIPNGWFLDLAFSPDGRTLATASPGVGGPVRFWDARTGGLIRSVDARGDPFSSLAFTRDGRLVGGSLGRMEVWDPTTGRRTVDWAALPHGVDRLVVAADGRSAAVSTPGIYFCTLGASRTGEPDIPMPRTLTGLALSPDGRMLATADGTETVRFWEVLTREAAAAIPFAEPVAGIAFSPDGRTLAAATGGGVHLFDLATGTLRFTLPPGMSADTLVAFSADGRRLASAGNRECTAMVWNVSDLREPAAGKVSLTPAQLNECWAALSADDAKVGYAAVWKLAAARGDVLPMLIGRLGQPGPGGDQIAKLIVDLDSPRFAVREQASRTLEGVGEIAIEPLRQARKGKVSAEQAERIDGLLGRLAGSRPSADRLRASRAVAILELIGDEKSQATLAELAKGSDTLPKTREAKAALERLK
jgi:WD40 repeat protein